MSDIIPSAPEPRPLPFHRPADYYAAPLSEVRPIFPRWVPFGCGSASLVINASGAVHTETVVLLTPEEVDAAAKKTVKYRAPGR